MAYGAYMTDRGYDLSLFETHGTSAPKLQPKRHKKKVERNNVILFPEVEYDKSARRKHNVAGIIGGFLMAAVIVTIVGIIIYGQVRLAELNQQIASAETQLSHSVSKYTQLQAKVESSLSTTAVEEYARTQLSMSKATNQQKEYISLSQGDKAEVYTEQDDTVFSVISKFIGSLWS